MHATKTELLKHIIGVSCPGLVPGGKGQKDGVWSNRNHVHCATALPVNDILPAGFRKLGIDCMIQLDAVTMHDMRIQMFMSDAHVCLVPEAIPIECIKRITLLQNPKLTVYRRPTAAELATIEWTTIITCRLCNSSWNVGTWLCLKCWEPLSLSAINDAQSFLPDIEESLPSDDARI